MKNSRIGRGTRSPTWRGTLPLLSHRLGQMVQAAEGRLFAPTFPIGSVGNWDLFPQEKCVEESLSHKQSWGLGNVLVQ